MSAKVWTGTPPCTCDVCGDVILNEFVDGKTTQNGCWALMCPQCHVSVGSGLGVGRGQRYELRGEDWVQVEGGASVKDKAVRV